ncbi:hypothetical protein SCD90_12775 [Terrihabitans sp. PJ23]|uniref:Uncharacterized protein n=1 Tax=Terrihabitans rhizophilus TaxID=3092662 RepID=A0ABU4RTH6_9HYPH|nr:hypothetical protein [Terrihabitans sp. PJ23]MDX6806940.1 hypothetical protein [Terrihabitans sp. PJ23]
MSLRVSNCVGYLADILMTASKHPVSRLQAMLLQEGIWGGSVKNAEAAVELPRVHSDARSQGGNIWWRVDRVDHEIARMADPLCIGRGQPPAAGAASGGVEPVEHQRAELKRLSEPVKIVIRSLGAGKYLGRHGFARRIGRANRDD